MYFKGGFVGNYDDVFSVRHYKSRWICKEGLVRMKGVLSSGPGPPNSTPLDGQSADEHWYVD